MTGGRGGGVKGVRVEKRIGGVADDEEVSLENIIKGLKRGVHYTLTLISLANISTISFFLRSGG